MDGRCWLGAEAAVQSVTLTAACTAGVRPCSLRPTLLAKLYTDTLLLLWSLWTLIRLDPLKA